MAKEKLEAKTRSLKTNLLKCIGEICFTDDGILVKIPKDADPECARKTADLILAGKQVQFQVEGKAEAEALEKKVSETLKEKASKKRARADA